MDFTATNSSEQTQPRSAPRTTCSFAKRTACVGTGASGATHGCRWNRPDRPRTASRRRRDEITLPLRGRPLRNRYVLRLIAVDRVIHFVVLAALGIAIILFAGHQKDLRGDYLRILNSLQASFGFVSSRNGFFREITHLVTMSSTKLYLYGSAFSAYAAINAVEAVGLWRESAGRSTSPS